MKSFDIGTEHNQFLCEHVTSSSPVQHKGVAGIEWFWQFVYLDIIKSYTYSMWWVMIALSTDLKLTSSSDDAQILTI